MKSKQLFLLYAPLILAAVSVGLAQCGNEVLSNDLAEIQGISGSNFCATLGATDIRDVGRLSVIRSDLDNDQTPSGAVAEEIARTAVLENFPSNQFPCIDLNGWPDRVGARTGLNYHKNTGFVQIESAKIPLIVTRRYQNELSAEHFSGTIFVRLSGGPGGIPSRPLNDFVIELGQDDLIIDFLYSGSGTNLIYPGPNSAVAADQVAAFTKQLRATNPRAQIVLFGESLGGLIALASLQNSEGSVDRTILLAPLAMSPSSFVDHSMRATEGSQNEDLMEDYRTIPSAEDNWSTRNIERLNRIDVLDHFFDRDEVDRSITDRLNLLPTEQILLIYGSSDNVVGVDILRDIPSSPNLVVREIEGMGHHPNESRHFRTIRDAIYDFSY